MPDRITRFVAGMSLMWVAALIFQSAAQSAGAAPLQIMVEAAESPQTSGPLFWQVPAGLDADQVCLLHAGNQPPIPGQCDSRGRLWWWNPKMAPRQTVTYTVEGASPVADTDHVLLQRTDDESIRVLIDGQLFTELQLGADGSRPFLYPVIGPTGAPVTRDYPMKDNPLERESQRQDHRHHQSIWTAHGDVRTKVFDSKGSSYWGIATEKGDASQRVKRIVRMESGPVFGEIEAEIEWRANDGRRELTENRTYTFFRANNDCRIIHVRNVFHFTDGDVVFADTKEGGLLAIRTAVTLDEVGGGTMCNSRGHVGEKACWGQPAEWCDYVGQVNGVTVGIAAMDAPTNFRHPTPWHIRGYGLFAANPFGLRGFTGDPDRDGSYRWKKGETAEFNYRILIHKGDSQASRVADAYRLYADPPTVQRVAAPPSSVVLGRRKQLFLDDYLIDSMVNIERVIQPARKYPGNPVLWKTEPWESNLNVLYGSVIRDNGKYRMWYKAGQGLGYAESDDGIRWSKPQFDLVLDDGHRTNRLFEKREKFLGPEHLPTFWEPFGVFRDDRDADPARRYKMGFLSIIRPYSGPRPDPFHPTDRRGLGVAGSPDGIHWTLIDAFATEAICDGATHWMLDPARNKYVLYGRTKKTLPEVEAAWSGYYWYHNWHSGRAVARVESDDFLKWDYTDPATAPVVLTADAKDEPGTEIYSMKVFPYEGIYIGLVQAFLARPDASWLDVHLAVSRDSLHFTRAGDGSPFIPLGPVGSWDRFNHSLANNPPIEVGDELRFYYGGRTYRHTPYKGKDTGPSAGGIGFAAVQRDRFVSLQASFDGGELLTRPVRIEGTNLHLNAKSDFGEIIIEILDRSGKCIARSRPVQRDGLDILVEWSEGAVPGDNTPVTLRISLKNACLFALWST